MIKLLPFILCLGILIPFNAASAEKIILDTDMVEGFDDGVAMTLLASSPDIDLLGVTIVAGNSWVAEGTAYGLRQLELINRTDVPVHMGLTRPLRPNRYETFPLEREQFGMGKDSWVGAFSRPDPQDWRAAYLARYEEEPQSSPARTHAVNFIIDTVRNNPGEVTIVAIGPLGNLALAFRMAPDIIPLIKRVVYMGGAFFRQGNVTPAAEFNWWFDPEAARIVVRSPLREQVVFGLDVCEKTPFTARQFNAVVGMLGGGSAMAALLDNTYVSQLFSKNPEATHYVWDVLTVAAILDPLLVTGTVERHIDVIDDFGLSYGQSVAFANAPAGTQKATIVTDVDVERFWTMLLDNRFWRPGSPRHDAPIPRDMQ